MQNKSPCLTASRCKSEHGYFSNRLWRFLHAGDMLALHGFPAAYHFSRQWQSVIRPPTLREMCGNAMSACVLKRIFEEILKARSILNDA